MQTLQQQLHQGIAMVSPSKATFMIVGRKVTINRGTLLNPTTCTQFLKHEGFSDATIDEVTTDLYADGDLASLLREHDPKGSRKKKAADRLPRLVAAAGATA